MRARPPKILLVTNWVGWGGAETQLDYLAIGLAEAGYSVRMLAIGELLRDTSQIEAAGVEVVALNAVDRGTKEKRFPKIVRAARWADLVHCTGWDATLWGRLAAILARRPALITEHTPGRDLQVTSAGRSRGRAIALHNRLLARFTYATIIVGVWQRQLLEAERVGGDRIVHIPNAVPIADLRRRAAAGPSRAELGIPEDALLVVQVARFKSQKRQLTTLHTVARLRERLGDVHAVFLGEGSEEAKVREEAERLGADWAHFLGFREDVPGVVGLSDLSVLPSSGEGLPMSLIESIALGVPTVATDVGDVRWLLETTGGGIVVPPGDDDAFLGACESLLGDAERRRRMGAAGAEAVASFDAPKMVDRYAAVFEACLAGAPPPQPAFEA
ncbi:MAG TPA: glycosyltransferase family 4 protein [Solirubrobacterales bacterium]|nr:glycosyltransferase family 4 protein [Solirubrobacterales bacterium]